MELKRKRKLMALAIAESIALSSISGCAKNVDCYINKPHAHLYINEDTGFKRYVKSEKETTVKGEVRTDEYVILDDEMSVVVKNNLYKVKDNANILGPIMDSYIDYRQAYTYDYRYGTYTGYGYGYNYSENKYEYFYGLHNDWHYDWDWDDISPEVYTTDKVRDVTYMFRFYKIDENGKLSSKLFKTLDDVEDEYKYFNKSLFVEKVYSNSYYLKQSDFSKSYTIK